MQLEINHASIVTIMEGTWVVGVSIYMRKKNYMNCDFNRLDYRILDVDPIDGVVLIQVILYYLSVSF